jgi:outer membrane protein TolC
MPTHEAIAQRAFELYQARGEGGGDPMADWLRAETELRSARV